MSTVKAINLQHPTSANANIVMDNAGNVGIGTSSPSSQLHVTSSGGYGVVGIGSNDSNGFHIAKDTGTNALNFYTGAVGSGTKRFGIDTSGRVTMPNQPGFYAYRTDGSYSPGAVALVYNNTLFNTGGHYSTSTGRFTAPVAGMYCFHHQQYWRGTYVFRSTMFKNGANLGLLHGGRGTGDGEWTANLTQITYLNVGDYVYCGITNAGELFMAVDHSWFCGYLIG